MILYCWNFVRSQKHAITAHLRSTLVNKVYLVIYYIYFNLLKVCVGAWLACIPKGRKAIFTFNVGVNWSVLLVQLLRPKVRQQYLAKVSDFMKTDNHRNWRFRQELAE